MTVKKKRIKQEKFIKIRSMFMKKNIDTVTVPERGKSEKVPQRQTEQSSTTSSNSNRLKT